MVSSPSAKVACLFASVITSLIVLSHEAQSEPASNIQLSQSRLVIVCQFIDRQFSRPIGDYVRAYGPILSSESQPHGKDSKLLTIRLAQQISVTYVVREKELQESVTNVEAKGVNAWRKLGLEIQSVGGVKAVLGEPDWNERQVMIYYGYGCDKFPESILQINLDEEQLSLYEIASAN